MLEVILNGSLLLQVTLSLVGNTQGTKGTGAALGSLSTKCEIHIVNIPYYFILMMIMKHNDVLFFLKLLRFELICFLSLLAFGVQTIAPSSIIAWLKSPGLFVSTI